MALPDPFQDKLAKLESQVTAYTKRRIRQYEAEVALLKRTQKSGMQSVEAAIQESDELLVVKETAELLGG